eukprot:ANDGO_08527.mRNA.1 hypothetical protein
MLDSGIILIPNLAEEVVSRDIDECMRLVVEGKALPWYDLHMSSHEKNESFGRCACIRFYSNLTFRELVYEKKLLQVSIRHHKYEPLFLVDDVFPCIPTNQRNVCDFNLEGRCLALFDDQALSACMNLSSEARLVVYKLTSAGISSFSNLEQCQDWIKKNTGSYWRDDDERLNEVLDWLSWRSTIEQEQSLEAPLPKRIRVTQSTRVAFGLDPLSTIYGSSGPCEGTRMETFVRPSFSFFNVDMASVRPERVLKRAFDQLMCLCLFGGSTADAGAQAGLMEGSHVLARERLSNPQELSALLPELRAIERDLLVQKKIGPFLVSVLEMHLRMALMARRDAEFWDCALVLFELYTSGHFSSPLSFTAAEEVLFCAVCQALKKRETYHYANEALRVLVLFERSMTKPAICKQAIRAVQLFFSGRYNILIRLIDSVFHAGRLGSIDAVRYFRFRVLSQLDNTLCSFDAAAISIKTMSDWLGFDSSEECAKWLRRKSPEGHTVSPDGQAVKLNRPAPLPLDTMSRQEYDAMTVQEVKYRA